MRCTVLLLLVACGRIGFDGGVTAIDGAPCIPADTHDEDRDGIADSCDVCPHLADATQLDKDGDRVGDQCDPEPERARQRIVVFDPFTSLAAWMPISTVVAGDDSVKLGAAGSQGSLLRAFVPANDTLVIGARTRMAGTGQRLLAIILKEVVDGRLFYCELFDDNAMARLMFTYTLDGGMTYVHAGSVPAPRLENGSGALTAIVDPDSGACRLAWNGAVAASTGPRPPEVDAQVLALYAENVDAELDYFLQIRTDP